MFVKCKRLILHAVSFVALVCTSQSRLSAKSGVLGQAYPWPHRERATGNVSKNEPPVSHISCFQNSLGILSPACCELSGASVGLAPGVKNSNSGFAWEEFYGAGECGQRSHGVRSRVTRSKGSQGFVHRLSPPPCPHIGQLLGVR